MPPPRCSVNTSDGRGDVTGRCPRSCRPGGRQPRAPQPPAPQAQPAHAGGGRRRGLAATARSCAGADQQRDAEDGDGQRGDDGGDVGGPRPALRQAGDDEQPGHEHRPDEQRLTAAPGGPAPGEQRDRAGDSSATGTATSSTRAASAAETMATTSAAAPPADGRRHRDRGPGRRARRPAHRSGPRAPARRRGRRGRGRGAPSRSRAPAASPGDARPPRRRSSRGRAAATAAMPAGRPRGSLAPRQGARRQRCRFRRSPRRPSVPHPARRSFRQARARCLCHAEALLAPDCRRSR